MKILIATGIYPPDIGGIATYSKNLEAELINKGHSVRVLFYELEKKMPTGIRHLWYFFRVIFNLRGVDLIIIMDTFSTGLPAVLAGKIFRKKTILRIGGDFLQESYIERTGDLLPLLFFYQDQNKAKWNLKERLIFSITKYVLHNAGILVFSTKWQRDLFIKSHLLQNKDIYIIENYYGKKLDSFKPNKKNFIFAGRAIKAKNQKVLEIAFQNAQKEDSKIILDLVEKVSHQELMEKIKNCYAVILTSVIDVSPNFILEAIKFNKPFIVTKYMGLSDRLGDIGIYIDPLDQQDIKEKILFLADDKNYEEYKKRIENFNFTHTWSEIADEFLGIYKKIK